MASDGDLWPGRLGSVCFRYGETYARYSATERLTIVQPREDGRSHGHGGAGTNGHPARKIVETYQETDRTQPPDDRVTIIGIPIEQITPSTQAALAGLVAENATLRSQVRRLEGGSAITKKSAPVLERDAFIAHLHQMLATSPGANGIWILMLVHVQTYEDIRRSSGVLAANTALDDVLQRLRQLDFELPAVANDDAPAADAPPPRATTGLMLTGYLGGLTLGVFVRGAGYRGSRSIGAGCSRNSDQRWLRRCRSGDGAGDQDGCGRGGCWRSALLAVARVDHLSRGTR